MALCLRMLLAVACTVGFGASGEVELVGTTTVPSVLESRTEVARAEQKQRSAVLILLNDDLSSGRRFQTFQWGSPINIEAHVDAGPGDALKLYVDECYGAPSADLRTSGKTYALVNNHGCLVDGKFGNSSFWSRTDDSILFTVQAFMLTEGNEEQVYLHCSLRVWNLKKPVGPTRKSCSYDLFNSRSGWQLLENATLNSICDCCETACLGLRAALRGDADPENAESVYKVALGPLTVRRSQSGWWEERCRSLKRFMLMGTAFVGSCLLGALFTGTLLVCALILGSYCRRKTMVRHKMPVSPYPPLSSLEKESPMDCNENDHGIE